MIKIAVGGAIDKNKVAENIKKIGGDKVTVKIMSDIQAAMEATSRKSCPRCSKSGKGCIWFYK